MDYIGATTQSLHDRLKSIHTNIHICVLCRIFRFCFYIEHREHGNRIMHEFLLGQENIIRDLPRPKSTE